MNWRNLPKHGAALAVVAAGVFAAPNAASACSVSPKVVEELRVSSTDRSCLSVEVEQPGDYDLPTLRVSNHCGTALEVRIPDCAPCDEWATNDCFDCSDEWVQLGGNHIAAPLDLVFQLDFPIDDHLGETVESSIDWVRGEESGELVLELDMVDKHPDQQANDACPGLCSVSTGTSPTALAAVLLLLGVWARRRPGDARSRTR